MKNFFWSLWTLIPGHSARAEPPTTPPPALIWTAADSTLKTHAYEFTLVYAFKKKNNKNTTGVKIKNTSGYEGMYSIHELEIYAADPRARQRIRLMARAALEFAQSEGIDVDLT